MTRTMKTVSIAIAVAVTAVVLGIAATRQDSSQAAEAAGPPAGNSGEYARLAAATPPAQPADAQREGSAMAAIREAAAANRHMFLFLYMKHDEQTGSAQKTFESTMGKIGNKADRAVVDCSAPAEKDLVEKFGLSTAPMPLILVLAPNGAITTGFPAGQVSEERLQDAFASSAMQKSLKALQERKLVILCAQNGATKFNSEAMSGVQAFKDDARFSPITEIVKVDPADADEAAFMAKLKLDPKTDQATTLVMAPPGAIVAAFKGATDKDTLFAAVLKGCGSGGCGPAGCK